MRGMFFASKKPRSTDSLRLPVSRGIQPHALLHEVMRMLEKARAQTQGVFKLTLSDECLSGQDGDALFPQAL